MNIRDFDYELPASLIAQAPSERRDESRLMTLDRATGEIAHLRFRDIVELLRPGDMLVLNDTRVIPAKLTGTRPTGGRFDVLLVSRASEGPKTSRDRWVAMVKSRGKLRDGETLAFGSGVEGTIVERHPDGRRTVEFNCADVLPRLKEIGEAPLPPYIKRAADERGLHDSDLSRYQTVYARNDGAIAAPTAGLHFTEELLERIRRGGVQVVFITLHVGIGTFKPVESETVEGHRMDAEHFEVSADVFSALRAAKEEGRRIVAVGTTVCRTIETIARRNAEVFEGRAASENSLSGWTDIFIYPPFEFKLVGGLVTNFHLPRGTPLLLVSAFAGRERILAAYETAKREGYRFYSYGDAMFVM
jgi:S-adenosylmethionine:tRNA ribosyltransferase-isomerase